MPKFDKITISNILIGLSLLFTIIGQAIPGFILEWSMNNNYLYNQEYFHYFLQFFTGTFLHGSIVHFIFNAIFIYYFGNILEIIIGKTKYLIIFILFVIINGILLSYFSPNSLTIGISGFAMLVLNYYTLELRKNNNPEYKGGITAIVINLIIGFYPGISLFGHFNGVIIGIIFFYLFNDFLKKQLIGLFNFIGRDKVKNFGTLNSKKD